ncbi:unnamed protein product [Bursaphelenchus xylophilus]|uniref:(pine wood nematode) hypothetical protein n=1 Tax=Bursaphelenchus xylophilus TaxID=6326 RepID=A0A1I7S7Q4_BURXY|nr:unnamed protein product [Bursaphelenchus xylophilus]CAG9086856.1 unnamed protein product [Bursaphelenchus xylophilus]
MLSLYGLGQNLTSLEKPKHQFFNTDYEEFMFDVNGIAVDIFGAPLHLPAETPVFVNVEGAPYPFDLQALVPGRNTRMDQGELIWGEHRRIIPKLPEGELKVLIEKQMVKKQRELDEFEEARKVKLDAEVRQMMAERAEVEKNKQREERLSNQRRRNQERRNEMNEVYERLMNREYQLEEQGETDEDDSSYSEGEAERRVNGRQPQTEDEEDEDEMADENDSDFDINNPSTSNPNRFRSGFTVTGRRRKKRNGQESTSQESAQQALGTATRYGRIARPPQRIYDDLAQQSPTRQRRRPLRRRGSNEPGPSREFEDEDSRLADDDASRSPIPSRRSRRIARIDSESPEPQAEGSQRRIREEDDEEIEQGEDYGDRNLKRVHHPVGEGEFDSNDQDASSSVIYGQGIYEDEVENEVEDKSDESFSLTSEDLAPSSPEKVEFEEEDEILEAAEDSFIVDDDLEDQEELSENSDEDEEEEEEAMSDESERPKKRVQRKKNPKKSKKLAKNKKKSKKSKTKRPQRGVKRKKTKGVISEEEEEELEEEEEFKEEPEREESGNEWADLEEDEERGEEEEIKEPVVENGDVEEAEEVIQQPTTSRHAYVYGDYDFDDYFDEKSADGSDWGESSYVNDGKKRYPGKARKSRYQPAVRRSQRSTRATKFTELSDDEFPDPNVRRSSRQKKRVRTNDDIYEYE